jgi:hypothetical protein
MGYEINNNICALDSDCGPGVSCIRGVVDLCESNVITTSITMNTIVTTTASTSDTGHISSTPEIYMLIIMLFINSVY